MSEKLKLSRININDHIDVSLFNADNVKIEGFSKSITDELSEHTATVASKETLGHVKVGDGLEVGEDGTVSISEEGVGEALEEHKADANNPHKVTKEQVGLGSVQNYGIATKDEAEKGLSNTKYMTALRTAEAIKALGASVEGTVKSVNAKKPTADGNVDLGELVHSVAGIAPDSTGDVPLTSSEINVLDKPLSNYAGADDIPMGISVFSINDTDDLPGYPANKGTVLSIKGKNNRPLQFFSQGNFSGSSSIITSDIHVYYRVIGKDKNWFKVLSTFDVTDRVDVTNPERIASASSVNTVNNAVKATTNDLDTHKKVNGGSYRYGHVMLSDNTNYTAGINDGVASTPLAVYNTMKVAKEANEKADQAFQLGVKQKQELATSLTSKGVSLPSDPSWEDVNKGVNSLKKVDETTLTLVGGKKEYTLPFTPNRLVAIWGTSSNVVWSIVDADRPLEKMLMGVDVFSNVMSNLTINIKGSKLVLSEALPDGVSVKLYAYGGVL